jgi:hypothetical protein
MFDVLADIRMLKRSILFTVYLQKFSCLALYQETNLREKFVVSDIIGPSLDKIGALHASIEKSCHASSSFCEASSFSHNVRSTIDSLKSAGRSHEYAKICKDVARIASWVWD